MPGLVTASRVYPSCGTHLVPNSGRPEFGCIHDFLRWLDKDVDGRHEAGHDETRQFEPALALIEARSASGSEPARAILVRGLRLVKVQ